MVKNPTERAVELAKEAALVANSAKQGEAVRISNPNRRSNNEKPFRTMPMTMMLTLKTPVSTRKRMLRCKIKKQQARQTLIRQVKHHRRM